MGHAPLDEFNSVRGLHEIIKAFFKPDFKMVEVGSFEGVSTILFSQSVETVYSVDCYDYPVPSTGRIPSHDQLFIDAEKTFIDRTKDIKNIIKIRKTSEEAAKDFPDKSLDAVYIDAEHDENSVRTDIRTWRPKIKFGGYLCGHDYNQLPVQKVLAEEGYLNITVAPDSSWVVKIPTVALVSVACTKVPETVQAMMKCKEQMEFNKIILFTDTELLISPGQFNVVQIPKLDYKQYNEFVAMKLWEYVDTDYVLLVQNDGYITDASQWTDEFLKWDYIGAPWPPQTQYTAQGEEIRVGNGGFSLRSRKLLRAPHILGFEFTDKGTGFWHEDGFLCVHYRKELEEQGIKFAPVEIAARFSTELTVPETVKSFGKHKYI